MGYLYGSRCNCPVCQSKAAKTQEISLAAKDAIGRLFKMAEKAAKKLHEKGGYNPEDLAKVEEYKTFIQETSDLFTTTITDNDVPEAMAKALKKDVFVFSGLRTHAQLYEASRLLTDAKGNIKSFEVFAQEFNAINEEYNQNYLQSEYQFAVASAQGAANWAAIEDGEILQYRTAQDDKVGDDHRPLHDITLPAEDEFWDKYYPPNRWRCRCRALVVRKGKYQISDSGDALALGEKATTQIGADGKNRLEIFRFNPGKQKVIFPPQHPYHKVAGATKAKKAIE